MRTVALFVLAVFGGVLYGLHDAERPVVLSAIAKGPDQIDLTWKPAHNPGYGYLVEIQSAGDARYANWTELTSVPAAGPYPGDPTGQHIYNPPTNGIAAWVTESQYTDQDGTPAQFVVIGLKAATAYRFRVRTFYWNAQPVYGPYSNVVAATTSSYQQLYVSPAGSDTADGSQAHPWLTLKRGAAALTCGQVLIALAGTYPNDQVLMSQACTADKRAVVQANPGDTVVIAPPPGASNAVVLSGTSLVIDGLSVRTATSDYEILIGGGHNALFNVETANGWGVHAVQATAPFIYRCYLHDAGSVDNGGGGFTLAVEHATGPVVWSSHLTRGSHDVSLCKQSCTGGRWLDNIMDGGWGMGFEAIEQSTGNLVEGNVIYHVQQLMGSTYKPGMELSSASNIARRNLLIGGKSTAIEVSALYGGDTAQNVKVYNNTIVNSFACLFQSQNDGGGLGPAAYDGFSFTRNICVGFLSKAVDIYLSNIQSQITSNDFGTDPAAKTIIWNHSAQASFQYPRTVLDADQVYSPPFSNNRTLVPRFNDPSSGDYHLHPLSGVPRMGAYAPIE